ncbi:GNAT family N-acetyltransferase [Cellulomonas sp. PhB150]|uniref:GNAT family N-acetyltransferase n=1 Tax=Cellulomonas sp. PhB150 TaxID=2485188 RepID=UPI000F460148|nr:GNAT family N-acetyltransferase [Cellulomonas sp. PhB150]ROS30629.1 L-amino acid N-acyltransferase YncA [Cellulomonas sp. PhB150]
MEIATLRRASVGDCEAIGRFQTRCWEQTYRGIVADAYLDAYLDATTWQTRSARWRDRIVSGVRDVWVAHRAGELVGIVSAAVTCSERADLPARELASIYLDEAEHGTGLAARLLDAAIGAEPAHLWVFSSNSRAQRFYAKHGFVATTESQVDPGTGVDEVRWVRT